MRIGGLIFPDIKMQAIAKWHSLHTVTAMCKGCISSVLEFLAILRRSSL